MSVAIPGRAPAAGAPQRWSRARVIWNPGAGAKPGAPGAQTSEAGMRRLMSAAGLGDELHISSSAGEARGLARAAVRDGYDLVVAAGGDGTIGTIATELLGSATALGILPLGSVMNVPRSLGLPREAAAAAAAIATGRVRAMDVGQAAGRPFFEAASVGMNAAMFREAQRFNGGDWSSIVRTLWVAIRYRPARMALWLDGRVVRTRALMVVAANGPYTGVGFTVAPSARLDDGRFDVVVFRGFSKLRLLRHLAGIAFGRYRPAPETRTYRAARVRVSSARPLPARADARDLGTTPIELETRRGALLVLVPADDQG